MSKGFKKGQKPHNFRELDPTEIERLFSQGLSKNQVGQSLNFSDAQLWKRIKASKVLLAAYQRGIDKARQNCCKGHDCDNCAICQTGRCCRNDDTDYKLPNLGDWNGIIYGELGVFESDIMGKAQCHACGDYFASVGNHAWNTHNLTAPEYRAIFGLNRMQSLAGVKHQEYLRDKMLNNPEHIEKLAEAGREYMASRTLEQMQMAGSRTARHQHIIDPKTRETAVKANVAAIKAIKKKVREGNYHPKREELTAEQRQAISDRSKTLWKNPTFRERVISGNKKTKNAWEQVTCQMCGASFEALKLKKRMVCSVVCRNRLIGLNNHKRMLEKRENDA